MFGRGLVGTTHTTGTTFYQLPIGGGGFVTGVSISDDGATVICRDDGGMAFKYDAAHQKWICLTNKKYLPIGFQTWDANYGAWEIVVAPSDKNRVYMSYQGFFFKSIDAVATPFVNMPAFNTVAMGDSATPLAKGSVCANGGAPRLFSPKMAVDPINPDICIVGSGTNGIYITRDGGSSFTWLSAIPASPSVNDKPGGVEVFDGDQQLNTAAGTSASSTLTFGTSGITNGMSVANQTHPTQIPAGTTVVGTTATTVTLSNTVTVTSGDAIVFGGTKTLLTSKGATATPTLTFDTTGAGAGYYVTNQSNLASIPANTIVDVLTSTSATLINVATGAPVNVTVASGDTINFNHVVNATREYAGYVVAFDPTVAAQSGGATQIIYISGYFSPIYKSTDGGTTWAPLNSGTFPTSARTMAVGPDQTLWVVSDGADHSGTLNNVWSCTTGGAWTRHTTANIGQTNNACGLAICKNDPAGAYRIAVYGTSLQGFGFTTNNFATNGVNYVNTAVSCDASWLNTHPKATAGAFMFDPSRSDSFIWATTGLGVFNGAIPPSNATLFTYSGIVKGIENLTPSQSLTSPGPGIRRPWVSVSDQGVFKQDPLGILGTLTTKLTNTNDISAGWGMDYASSDTSFFCVNISFGGTVHSGYSLDGGQTFTEFSSQPTLAYGGCIAAATPQHIVFCPGKPGGDGLPRVSLDQGASWTIPHDLPTNFVGYVNAYTNRCQIVCADKDSVNAPDTFYICYVVSGDSKSGIWTSTNGGVNWTQTCGISAFPGVIATSNHVRLTSWPGEPAGTLLWKGDNSVIGISTNAGRTWGNLNTLLTSVIDYGYGATRPGFNHTTLWVMGTYNSVAGIFKSHDKGQSFVPVSDLNPFGIVGILNNIGGDMNVYGRAYVTCEGQAWLYCNYVTD